MPCFVVSFCSLVRLFFHGKKKARTKTLAKKAASFNLWDEATYIFALVLLTAQRLSRQVLSFLFYQIALICSSQATLRVGCTL